MKAIRVFFCSIIIVLSFSLVACRNSTSDSDHDDLQVAEFLIVGEWDWVYSVPGWNPDSVLTPQNAGYSMTWRFLQNKTYVHLKDNAVLSQGNYDLRYHRLRDREPAIELRMEHTSAFIEVSLEQLTIDQAYVDGTEEHYCRIDF